MNGSLEPLRVALLADAQADAERTREAARTEAAARLAAAEREGEGLVERARREGASAATIQVARDGAEARRRGRALLLAAQRDVYEELRRRALADAAGLRGTPRFAALLDRLRSDAHARLGAGARVEAAADGGVVGSCGARSVDYSLDALVDRALARVGGLEELWR